MGTRHPHAYRPSDPLTVREIVEAAVYVVGMAVAFLALLFASAWLLAAMDGVWR